MPQLRDYQQRAVAATRELWATGKGPVCIVAGTGAGKTVIAETLLEGAQKPLAITHTRVLLEQTKRRIPNAAVMTVQSLLTDSLGGNHRRAELAKHDVVFLDECHHLAGAEWRAIMPLLSGARVFGCTATPQRADGTPLGDVFKSMVVAAQYSELLRGGHLCECDVDSPAMTRSQMKRAKVRPQPAQAYLVRARRDDGSWRPGILFAPTISICQEHVQTLTEGGVRAALVCCDTDEHERQQLFDRYNAGELDLLASPMALSEGFDAPRAEVCVLGRSAGHVGTYLQMVGRVLRPHPDKARALLIDCSDAMSLHGHPTDDRHYSLDGKGISKLETAPEEQEENEGSAPDAEELIEMEFTRIRQQLADSIDEIETKRREQQYRDGWVYHQVKERFGVELPRRFESKYKSVCVACRHRVPVGASIYWQGPKQVYHVDCWIQQLPREVLETIRSKQ